MVKCDDIILQDASRVLRTSQGDLDLCIVFLLQARVVLLLQGAKVDLAQNYWSPKNDGSESTTLKFNMETQP